MVGTTKCLGSLALAMTLFKYGTEQMMPLWNIMTPNQRVLFKIFIPGVLSMSPAGMCFCPSVLSSRAPQASDFHSSQTQTFITL